MKAFYLAALAVGAMSVAVAQVSPEDHAAHHSDQAATSKTDSPSKKEKPAPSTAGADMQARMKSMRELMDKLGQTKDPAERARLLAEHGRMMHEQLGSMMHMGCSMSDGTGKAAPDADPAHPGMGGKDAAGKEGGGMMSQGGMMGGGMMKCHELMQTRMDMMVGMMDQMMRHEEAQNLH